MKANTNYKLIIARVSLVIVLALVSSVIGIFKLALFPLSAELQHYYEDISYSTDRDDQSGYNY